ncbi:hypothetical protein PVK06_024319 [Gossypium arboreum]|uniref:Uncharacterized protein n=1 Tax=Gossypium arboreum TaxID=29729 RepID=A0ABR0PDJ3_GOSAR|nr:hypothetical protein PVK06_024319 [Gossypium arboreum]
MCPELSLHLTVVQIRTKMCELSNLVQPTCTSRDDCLIFEEYLMEGTNHVWEFLREYEVCSGQMVNYDKSLIYFIPSVDDVVCKGMVMALGVRMSSNLEKYLGMPIVVGWNKRLAFCHIKEQMKGELMVCVPVAYPKE